MDILIPLAASKIDYLDLRYTLRGIEKYLKGYDDIYIVGEKPEWIQGVVHIDHSDDPNAKFKERNIWKKIMAGCINNKLSQEFLFLNDDHILVDNVDADGYPFYYKGSCLESTKINKSSYKKTMQHTRNFLLRRHFRDFNADTHTPIRYTKKEFLSTFEPEHWLTPWGYGIKSMYCAINKKELTFMEDCKIRKPLTEDQFNEIIKDRHVISCTDEGLMGMLEYLDKLLPERSSYEKQ